MTKIKKIKSQIAKSPIPLFYWSEVKFTFKENENYGDLLSKYLVEKISDRPVIWVHPKKQPWYKLNKRNYLAIGSIIHHATKDSIVWGSGIIDKEQKIAPADFKSVRGPRTQTFLQDLGYNCPEIYGDPALLLPLYYHPQIKTKYEIGIVPHYRDYKDVAEAYMKEKRILVIDMMTTDVEKVTNQILQCEAIISSSLHGVIVSHAYGIPGVWVKFSDKIFGSGIKYLDYLESVKIQIYNPEFLNQRKSIEELRSLIQRYPSLPAPTIIAKLQEGLLKSCPFRNDNF